MRTAELLDRELSPDLFAAVMATGIVATAVTVHGYPLLGDAFWAVATVVFLALVVLFAARVTMRHRLGVGDFGDHDIPLRAMTFVAACLVLGTHWSRHPVPIWISLAVAAPAWIVLGWCTVVAARRHTVAQLRDGAHGGWLLAAVATAALSIAASALATHDRSGMLLTAAAVLWLLALALYVVIALLIVWRALETELHPERFAQAAWILMGGLAICTLAGDRFHSAAHVATTMDAVGRVAELLTLVTLVVASCLIPVFVYAELWRAERRGWVLRVDASWWAAVFPLGMYAVATSAEVTQRHSHLLATVSRVFCWIAVGGWVFVAVEIVRNHLASGPGRGR